MSRDLVVPALVVVASIAVLVVMALPGGDATRNGAASQRAVKFVRARDEKEELRSEDAKKHQARECVSRILRGDADERAQAVAILRNLGDEGLAVLRETFAKDENPRKREAAAFGLALLGSSADRDRVAEAFVAKKGQPTALMAAAAAQLRDPGLVREFLDLRDSKDWRVREAVALALRADTLPNPGDIMPLLADGEPRVREAAERTLTGMLDRMDQRSVEQVVNAALDADDPLVQETALRVCSRVDRPWAVKAAMRGLDDPKASVRAEAIRVLTRKGDSRARGALIELMREGDGRRERVRAANALGSLERSPEMIEQLAETARGSDPIVSLAASRSLAAQGDSRAIDALLRLRKVRKSADLDVDDEDAMLLRSLSEEILVRIQGREKRRPNEDWAAWWKRVRGKHSIPPRVRIPEFPENH